MLCWTVLYQHSTVFFVQYTVPYVYHFHTPYDYVIMKFHFTQSFLFCFLLFSSLLLYQFYDLRKSRKYSVAHVLAYIFQHCAPKRPLHLRHNAFSCNQVPLSSIGRVFRSFCDGGNGGPSSSGRHLEWPHFRNRKWGHPSWQPKAEGPPFSTTTTMGSKNAPYTTPIVSYVVNVLSALVRASRQNKRAVEYNFVNLFQLLPVCIVVKYIKFKFKFKKAYRRIFKQR